MSGLRLWCLGLRRGLVCLRLLRLRCGLICLRLLRLRRGFVCLRLLRSGGRLAGRLLRRLRRRQNSERRREDKRAHQERRHHHARQFHGHHSFLITGSRSASPEHVLFFCYVKSIPQKFQKCIVGITNFSNGVFDRSARSGSAWNTWTKKRAAVGNLFQSAARIDKSYNSSLSPGASTTTLLLPIQSAAKAAGSCLMGGKVL